MTIQKDVHPDEAQLLQSIVDDEEMSKAVQEHLSTCSSCRTRKERVEEDLARLGRMARHFAPEPAGKVLLPSQQPANFGAWLWNWRGLAVMGTAAASVVVVVLALVLMNIPREDTIALLNREMIEDEQFIVEISRLEENALPALYLEISGELEPDPATEALDDGRERIGFNREDLKREASASS